MSEEKKVEMEEQSLEKQFYAIVGEKLNDQEYPNIIDRDQFNLDNTIINASFLLNEVLYQSTTVSVYIVKLLQYHIKFGDQLLFKDEKDTKVYLQVLQELTNIKKLVKTKLQEKL